MKNILRFLSLLFCLFSITNLLHAQWVQTSCPISDIKSFAVIGDNLFAGTSNGVYLSTNNGANWNSVNSGWKNNEVNCLAVMGTKLFAGTSNGIHLSTNNGINWAAIDSGLTNNCVSAFAVCGNNIFAGTSQGAGVFLSTNNGTNWTEVSSGLPDTLHLPNVTALAVFVNEKGDTNLFAGINAFFYGGVYLSTNNGTNWTAVESGLTNTWVISFAVCGNNIFAGTYDGVFLSSNNGTSWSAINSGLPDTPFYPFVPSFAMLPNGENGTNIFAGTSDGVYLSTNYGTSWNAVKSGVINGAYIQALTLFTNDKGDTNLFAGTNLYGVWQHPFSKYIPTISLDYCRLEFDLPAGILNQTKTIPLKITSGSLTSLAIDSVYTMTKWFSVASVQGTVATGDTVSLPITFTPNTERDTTYLDTLCIVSNSIYPLTKIPLTGMLTFPVSVLQNSSDIPKNYWISQNYPNPFNPTTVINYQLPVSSIVTLKVYDILGREIATLVNARINAGYHSVTFNGEHLSSGIYFYRLQADSYIQTKKLILLK